tara:strand:+ start:4913 stop:5353 length:441 start_codon:yes stop_codon:yes gene_type:complete
MDESINDSAKIIEKSEFRVFNKSIEMISFGYGIFLIIWGITVSFLSQSTSFTSFIPSIFGVILALIAILAIRIPTKNMLCMHIAVVLGVLIWLGGSDFFRSLVIGSNPFTNIWAGSSKLMMFMTATIFIFMCIKSFRFARRLKNTK